MLDALKDLQEKASDFFAQYEKKYQKQMKCASGCSHCCIAGLSIFSWEAELILDWFKSLDKEEAERIVGLWKNKSDTSFTNVSGEKATSCSFLVNDQCSIYPRRPIICRTQGMGLKWSENGKLLRDHCPLNFQDPTLETSQFSKLEDELNLDVLNQMISQAQIIFTSQSKSSLNTDQLRERVSLKELKDYLERNY